MSKGEVSESDRGRNSATQDFEQLLEQLREQLPESLGPLLEEFRPYLLTIAVGEFPEMLRGKLGASDLVQDTIL